MELRTDGQADDPIIISFQGDGIKLRFDLLPRQSRNVEVELASYATILKSM